MSEREMTMAEWVRDSGFREETAERLRASMPDIPAEFRDRLLDVLLDPFMRLSAEVIEAKEELAAARALHPEPAAVSDVEHGGERLSRDDGEHNHTAMELEYRDLYERANDEANQWAARYWALLRAAPAPTCETCGGKERCRCGLVFPHSGGNEYEWNAEHNPYTGGNHNPEVEPCPDCIAFSDALACEKCGGAGVATIRWMDGMLTTGDCERGGTGRPAEEQGGKTWLHETFPAMLRDPVVGLRVIGMWIEQDVDYMCGHEGAEECPDEDGCTLAIYPDAMYEALYEYAEVMARRRATEEPTPEPAAAREAVRWAVRRRGPGSGEYETATAEPGDAADDYLTNFGKLEAALARLDAEEAP